MKKSKKISVNTLENITNEDYTPVTTVDWHGAELAVKKTLSLGEMMAFVDLCVGACFKDDDGSYMPEKLHFAIKNCVVGMYTNVSLPENIEKRYDLIYRSDLIPTVMLYIDIQQFDEICEAIHTRVEYRANANIKEMTRRVDELYTALEDLSAQFEKILSGINPDDMKALMGALSNGGLSEEKLVRAYMSQKKEK